MIKQFSAGDIITRPFKTFKSWRVQSVDPTGVDAFGHSNYFVSCSEVNRGQKIETPFYPSGSPKYNPVLEPMTPTGKYERMVYATTDAMFYRNPINPLESFGVESIERDPDTGKKEVREINGKIVSVRLAESYWGEKIVPKSVVVTDKSNLHATYQIHDDGMTNLYITGSHFGDQQNVGAINPLPPLPYWDTSSGQFYATINGVSTPVSAADAKKYMGMGIEVSYESDGSEWKYDYTAERNYFQPENERFGQSVSAWYKYVAVGSPMDQLSLSPNPQGYAAIYKYDDATNQHRLIKKFYSPYSAEGLALEFGENNMLQLENNSFWLLETSSLDTRFGTSVSVRDNFLAVGSPNTESGSVFVYDRFKGGSDNWGLINMLSGSASGSEFGRVVSLDDDVLAVGAPKANGNTGEVVIYRLKRYMDSDVPCRSIPTSSGDPTFVSGNFSWEYEATLTSSVAQPNDYFGYTLSVSNGNLIVGNGKLNGNGYATLFTCNYVSASVGDCPTASWAEVSNFYADETIGDLDPNNPDYAVQTPLSFDAFGWSVAIDGDNMIIGSQYDKAFLPYDGAPTASMKILGAVYFYRKYQQECIDPTGSVTYITSYHQIQKTFGDVTHTSSKWFGRNVAIDEGRAAVFSGPDRTARLVYFSGSNYILEDESYQSTGSEDSVLGRVSLFTLNTNNSWTRVGEIRRNKEENKPYYVFGQGLAMSSDFLAVGAPIYNEATGSDTGSILDHNLQISHSFSPAYSGSVFIYDFRKYKNNPLIGNVFYKNGYIVLTNTSSNYANIFTGTGSYGFDMTYQGTHTIYEHEYFVSLRPGEFNYSTNPTSLIDNTLLFDVNGDRAFDLNDVDLILKYLNKKKYYTNETFDDNGIVLEQDNRLSAWWNNELLLTEAGDVLLQEGESAFLASIGYTAFTKTVFDYIEANLDKTGILDIDGNGVVDIRDGAILVAHFTNQLTPAALNRWIDANSTRRYVKDIETYLAKFTGRKIFDTDPDFFGYQASSSYDPTGSYLAPYITTIGLYDQSGALVGVGKLGKPIKNLIDWPINFIVRFDT